MSANKSNGGCFSTRADFEKVSTVHHSVSPPVHHDILGQHTDIFPMSGCPRVIYPCLFISDKINGAQECKQQHEWEQGAGCSLGLGGCWEWKVQMMLMLRCWDVLRGLLAWIAQYASKFIKIENNLNCGGSLADELMTDYTVKSI